MNYAHIFPGQGVQYAGMGLSLYERSKVAREIFDNADEILGFSLTKTMFYGSDVDLLTTRITQPAVYVNTIAEYIARPHMEHPYCAAGHSLGEYAALVAADVLDFEEGLRLVVARADAMYQTSLSEEGAMASIIGLTEEKVEDICARHEGLYVANYNCPGHVVISTTQKKIDEVEKIFRQMGAKRFIQLDISVAAHSPYMESARKQLADAINSVEFRVPNFPIYQNIDGKPHTNPNEIKSNLLNQLTAPVRWTESIRNMRKDGVDTFCEFGSDNVLTKMIEWI